MFGRLKQPRTPGNKWPKSSSSQPTLRCSESSPFPGLSRAAATLSTQIAPVQSATGRSSALLAGCFPPFHSPSETQVNCMCPARQTQAMARPPVRRLETLPETLRRVESPRDCHWPAMCVESARCAATLGNPSAATALSGTRRARRPISGGLRMDRTPEHGRSRTVVDGGDQWEGQSRGA